MKLEAFGEALKIFLEKRLIPTVVSFVVAIIVYSKTPNNNALLLRIGKELYILLYAGIVFVIISFLQFLYKKIKESKHSHDEKVSLNNYSKKRDQEELQKLWDYMDTISSGERVFVKKFIENGNKPISLPRYMRPSDYNSIVYNRELVKCREITGSDKVKYDQYVLDDSFYKTLSFSLEKYNKICNFEENEK